jgi:CRISPR-associated protein Cas5h
MLGLSLRVECPYFATFRKPTTTSIILTYLIPPYTTIRGMLSNALGLPRDDYRVQEWFKIGIKPLRFSKSKEMAKILKLKRTGKTYQKSFPSSPIFREFLVEPSYEIFLVGDDSKITEVYSALKNPRRPLYFGGSDDIVDLDVFEPMKVEEKEVSELRCVVEGIYKGCVIEKVPYKFVKMRKNFNVVYKTVSIPVKDPIKVKRSFKAIHFGDWGDIWVI